MFEGDSADTGAGNFPLVSMGAERRVSRPQTRERGPPSALAESFITVSNPTRPGKVSKQLFTAKLAF
jgi:hypothetical protein